MSLLLSYNLLLKQTVTGGNVRHNFTQVNAGTTYNNALVFDQGNICLGCTDASARLHVQGTGRITSLAGVGNRMVIANSSGDLSTQAIPTDVSIYNSNGTLTGDRTVTTGFNSLTFGSDVSTSPYFRMTYGNGVQLKYNANSQLSLGTNSASISTPGSNVVANASTVQISTNGSTGTFGQFLKSNGSGQTVWALPYDGVIQQTGNSVTFTNGSAASIFSGATTGGGASASGTTFT